MTKNPFRKTFRATPKKPRHAYRLVITGLATLTLVLLMGAGAWMARNGYFSNGLPNPLTAFLPGDRLFQASATLNREEARALYRRALANLESGNHEEALSQFKELEAVYPGLKELLWLHEAEAYAAQGNEWAVQKKLGNIASSSSGVFRALALYRIGQSQFRGSEWEKADKTFRNVAAQAPKATYATGSLYYQGTLLARDSKTKAQAISPLEAYLAECPDCKFSGESAEALEKLLPHPSPRQHALIGLAQSASGKDARKAISHLRQGPRNITWQALGKALIRNGQKPQGVQILVDGLRNATNMDEAQETINLILANTPGTAAQLALLTRLDAQNLQIGGDYILWKLADLRPDQGGTLYRHILQRYPDGDYAPESGWRLLWPLLNSGQRDAFIAQGQNYLSRYGYARSAPKVLFWMGKLLEKSNLSEATRAYQHLLEQYPGNYYAFRASGRLQVLAGGKTDPGWTVRPSRQYPPSETNLNLLDILPPAGRFGDGQTGEQRRQIARELQIIGAPEDVKLLVSETTGALTPAVESWAAQIEGDRAQGIRLIRDALDKQFREAFQAHPTDQNKAKIPPAGTTDELKLLYPVYFAEHIAPVSRNKGLDPFLVQALMREESYFNEFAISSSNARGLMQLLPTTAREVAGWERMPAFQTSDLFLPAVNIRLGSRYLAFLHAQFNGNSMPSVGAYNGGPGAMRRWIQGSADFTSDPDMFVERIPYDQSRDYIKKVFGAWWNYQHLYGGAGT